jgi:hypothetical protein
VIPATGAGVSVSCGYNCFSAIPDLFVDVTVEAATFVAFAMRLAFCSMVLATMLASNNFATQEETSLPMLPGFFPRASPA